MDHVFIELHQHGVPIMINADHILAIQLNLVRFEGTGSLVVDESYEEIKSILFGPAQNDEIEIQHVGYDAEQCGRDK